MPEFQRFWLALSSFGETSPYYERFEDAADAAQAFTEKHKNRSFVLGVVAVCDCEDHGNVVWVSPQDVPST